LQKLAERMLGLIDINLLRRLLIVSAWAGFALIVFVTLAPVVLRPVVTPHADLERFAAFAVLGLLFGLAYPHRLMADLSFVVCAAIVLETLQLITRDRHGHLSDVLAKAAGGAFGIGLAMFILSVAKHYKFASRLSHDS
jgi:VanZ like family